jgi:hypothetical protein
MPFHDELGIKREADRGAAGNADYRDIVRTSFDPECPPHFFHLFGDHSRSGCGVRCIKSWLVTRKPSGAWNGMILAGGEIAATTLLATAKSAPP